MTEFQTNDIYNSKVLGYSLSIFVFSLFIHVYCMATTDLLVEEAYYWNYAQHLALSYLDHPPMVALLIKISTTFFGLNALSLRLPSLICWFITLFFNFKLTSVINKKSGLYSLILLCVLPFFFWQTLVITPDLPLLACWSAVLYFLYQALVLNRPRYWYLAGLAIGLGMVSKYTIVLLGLTTIFYLILTPNSRFWFKRKEPYLCALIAVLLFSPVIYWNATHEWISFLFQSKRRFASVTSMDLPYLIGLIIVFLTPLGVLGIVELLRPRKIWELPEADPSINFTGFIRIFIFVPLGFFVLYSLSHEINLNWIGPLFLALIPWLALLMSHSVKKRLFWMGTSFLLLASYAGIIAFTHYNTSEILQEKLLIKMVAWERLVQQFHQLAQEIETTTQKTPVFIPLDNFPIGSELSFYQTKFLQQRRILSTYSIQGPHIFGLESLMYRYWSDGIELTNRPLILISKELWRFEMPDIDRLTQELTPLKEIRSYGQGRGVKNIPFYYKVVMMK